MKKDLTHNGHPKSSLLFINNYKALHEKRFLASVTNKEEGLAFITKPSPGGSTNQLKINSECNSFELNLN